MRQAQGPLQQLLRRRRPPCPPALLLQAAAMAQRCRGAVAQMLGLALLLASAVAATAADPWSVLGLSRGEASEADVKRAYRALALELHPDKVWD